MIGRVLSLCSQMMLLASLREMPRRPTLSLEKGGHEVLDERILGRGADAVVTAGDDTEQTAVGRAVFGAPIVE